MRRLMCLLALFFLPMWVRADVEVVKPMTEFYVADYADVLSDGVERRIVIRNDRLYSECGAQIVVVTVNTVGETGMENYAYALFNEWGIGDARKNNGLLILLAVEDRKYWLMPGTGIQDELTAEVLQELAKTHLVAPLSEGLYDEAVWGLFEACLEPVRDASQTPRRTVTQAQNPFFSWLAGSRLIEPALLFCVLLRFLGLGRGRSGGFHGGHSGGGRSGGGGSGGGGAGGGF